MKWIKSSPGQVYDCGEELVVYFDTASGNTHLISAFAAFLLEHLELQTQATETGQLAKLIAQDIEHVEEAELLEGIPTILDELAALHIVTAIPQ